MKKSLCFLTLLTLNLKLCTLNCSAQDGSLDLSFGTGGKVLTSITGLGYSIALQPDGKIIYCGSINSGTSFDFAVCRFNADGSLDASFGTGGTSLIDVDSSNQEAEDVALQSDGKILLAGYTNVSGNIDFLLVRLNTNGTLDTTFNSTGILKMPIGMAGDYGNSVAVQADGKILMSGHTINFPYADFAIIRVNANGSLDTAFDSDGIAVIDVGGDDDLAPKIVLQTDGKIVLTGDIWTGANFYDFGTIRLRTNGSLDTSFGTGGKIIKDGYNDMDVNATSCIQSDGKIVTGGTIANSGYNFGAVRYNADGSIDNTWSGDGMSTFNFSGSSSEGKAMAIQADGKIVQAGLTMGDYGLLRYKTDGSLDSSFGVNGQTTTDFGGTSEYPTSMLIQPDAKIIVAGTSDGFFSMARYNVSPVGISEISAFFDLAVFPNPTNAKINLSFKKPITNASLKITNSTGQTILSQNNVSGNNFAIDVSQFVNGFYFLEMNDGEIISRTKFVKD